MERIKKLIESYENIYEELSNQNYEAEEKVYDLEEKIEELMDEYSFQDDYLFTDEPREWNTLNKLKCNVKKMKREFDFYDEQAELDRMFPNRHDEDFDEDDMGFRNVFGDD